MAASRMTFGEHLKQFALSIDFLDATHYELIQRHLLQVRGRGLSRARATRRQFEERLGAARSPFPRTEAFR